MKLIGTAGFGMGFGSISSSCAVKSNSVIYKAEPLAQDYTKVFYNSDSDTYVDGCGLTKMPDGTFIAIVPVVVRGVARKRVGGRGIIPSNTNILRSTDGGQNWHLVSQLPYFSAVPWVHKGILYLFTMSEGIEYRNDDLFLLRSKDNGKTWSDPVTLFKGHFWNAHTGMVIRDDRIYWAVDDIPRNAQKGPPQRCPRVIAGDLTKDLMDPRSWRLSDPITFPKVPGELVKPGDGLNSHSLEPNVIGIAGKIRVISAVKPGTTAGLAAVFDLDDDGESLKLSFTQYHPNPGGHLKFCIIWDELSKMFWLTANLCVDSQNMLGINGMGRNSDRRFLMLFYGVDGLNWFQACCVAQAKHLSQSFMYPASLIDGNDLVIISRSSIIRSGSHDADHATFHRVKDFRRLALNIIPQAKRK